MNKILLTAMNALGMNNVKLTSGRTTPVRNSIPSKYNITQNSKDRKAPPTKILAEEQHLTQDERQALIGSSNHLYRNFSIVYWIVNKHLDAVSSFNFRGKNENPELDLAIEAIMRWWSNAQNCDQTQRHSLSTLIRMIESLSALSGDCLVVKGKGRISIIEPDRIRNPETEVVTADADKYEWVQGIKINKKTGIIEGYCVWERDATTTYKNPQQLKVQEAWIVGYFNRYDQYRGVSLLAPVLEDLTDLSEVRAATKMKIKLAASLGVIITRDGDDPLGKNETCADPNTREQPYNDISLGDGRPYLVDMRQGDDAKVLESATPSPNEQQFHRELVQSIARAFEVDISMYDASATNFNGSRAAGLQFKKSLSRKQDRLEDLLDKITYWILSYMKDVGVFKLPDGMTIGELKWEWVPDAIPAFDANREADGYAKLIEMGLMTPQKAAKEMGGDYEENLLEIQKAIEMAKTRGLTLRYGKLNIDGAPEKEPEVIK